MNFVVRIIQAVIFMTFTAHGVFASCTDCTTLEFGKKFQLPLLQPMFSMNTQEKLRYLTNQGIDLFKFHGEKAPANLLNLSVPPKNLQNQYQSYFAEDGVLGIYLTERLSRNNVSLPTILLVDHADDWTITHEYMHYLFDRARALEDPTSESLLLNNMNDAKEDYFSTLEKYKSFNRYIDHSHKVATIENFVVFANLQVQILVSFVLEEVAIEKFLGLVFLQSKPRGLDQEAYDHSLIYIRSSGKSSLKQLQIILDSCQDLKKSLEQTDKTLLLSLHQVCTNVKQHKQSLLKIGQELNLDFENRSN